MHIDRTAYEEHVENATKEGREIASRAKRKLTLLEQQLKIQQEMLQIQIAQ
jgi:hypothetical protein